MIRLIDESFESNDGLLVSPNLVEDIFKDKGWLESILDFERRDQQLKMSLAVKQALEREGNLVFEAGTGIGKSLAYLYLEFCMQNIVVVLV